MWHKIIIICNTLKKYNNKEKWFGINIFDKIEMLNVYD